MVIWSRESLLVPESDLIVCLDSVEDHGVIVGLFEEQTNPQLAELLNGAAIRKEFLEGQNEQNHTAVCVVCPHFYTFLHSAGMLSAVLTGQS